MKFTKKKDYNGSVRKVFNDDKSTCYGIVGTVGDLLNLGILDYASCERDTWMFIPNQQLNLKVRFGNTKKEALQDLE